MAKTETITCDICGKTKGAVNHWYHAKAVNGGFWLIPFGTVTEPNFGDYCGQECVIKAVNEYLSGGK